MFDFLDKRAHVAGARAGVDNEVRMVAADLRSGEIDGRIGQAEDVGPPSAAGFDFSAVGYDAFDQQFVDQFGDGRGC